MIKIYDQGTSFIKFKDSNKERIKMKEYIIFSPSKTMDLGSSDKPPFLDKTALKILENLEKMTKEELLDFFKIKKDLADQVFDFYKNIRKNTAKAAIETYKGISFSQLDEDLCRSDFAKEHFVILSALYGPISPLTNINPYRLDFSKALKIEGDSLKNLQKKNYTEKLKSARIYNLASLEFSERIDKKQMGDWIDIDFYENYENSEENKKAPSATSKKLRGRLASHILKAESFDKKVFESFSYQGYKLNPTSDKNNYIYSK